MKTKNRKTSKRLNREYQAEFETVKRTQVKRAPRKLLALSYIPIAHHVYYDGHSFRTRVAKEGKTDSWNTSDKKKAIEYRDFLLLTR